MNKAAGITAPYDVTAAQRSYLALHGKRLESEEKRNGNYHRQCTTGVRPGGILSTLGLVVITAVASYVGVALYRRWAQHRNLLDIPNERSSHDAPTVRGGGLVIALLMLAGIAVGWTLFGAFPPRMLLAYLVAAGLIAVVSWVDDNWGLSNKVRFAAHCLAGALVLFALGFVDTLTLPLIGGIQLGVAGLFLSLFWLVGLTNAYNFMDGIDGMAGTQALIAGIGWVALGWLSAQPFLTFTGLLLAGVSFGFLVHNWSPADVFMGDVGSAFLGFTLAVLVVAAARLDPRMALAGALLVWPFIFDTSFTLIRRWRNGENIFAAHRSHLYQRLVIAGYTHAGVSLLYGLLAMFGLILALGWITESRLAAPGMVLLIPLALGLVAWVRAVELRQGVTHPPTAKTIVPPASS